MHFYFFAQLCSHLFFSKSKILVKLNQLRNGSSWRHLAHQKRPPTLTSLAPLARPLSAGVFGKPSDARPRRFYLCTANIHSCLGRRLTLTWLDVRSSSSGLARCALKTLVVERWHRPSHVRLRNPGQGTVSPATTVLPRQPRARTAAITHSQSPRTLFQKQNDSACEKEWERKAALAASTLHTKKYAS